MSFNVTACGVATGLGLTVYGGYKYLTTNQKSAIEVSPQKKLGLVVTAIAVGAGLIFSGLRTTQDPAFLPKDPDPAFLPKDPDPAPLPKDPDPAIPPSIPNINNVANCPINTLKNILNEGVSDSITYKTFKVLEDTQGISCDNYLTWQDEFLGIDYIDRIQATHLQKPAMWGIDKGNRPYIAIKYLCNQSSEGAVALFQRYTTSSNSLVRGGHFKPEGCPQLGPLDPINTPAPKFLDSLTSFFKGGDVISPDNNILTLAK